MREHKNVCVQRHRSGGALFILYDVKPAIAKDHSLAIAMMQIYTLHMRRQQAKYRFATYGKKEHFITCCA
ncbi:MAG: hypothetical protein ACLR52_00470 [Veillonella atypica]